MAPSAPRCERADVVRLCFLKDEAATWLLRCLPSGLVLGSRAEGTWHAQGEGGTRSSLLSCQGKEQQRLWPWSPTALPQRRWGRGGVLGLAGQQCVIDD